MKKRYLLLLVLMPVLITACGGGQPAAPTGVVVTPQVAGSPVPTAIANPKVQELENKAATSEDAETHFQLGNAYAETGRYPEAELAFSRALKIDPSHLDAKSNLGVIYYKQGRLTEAEALVPEVLGITADDAEILYNLGGALAAQQKLDEAVVEFVKASEADPELAQPYLGLGTVYQTQGKKAEAIEALQKYVELSDDPTWREQAKSMLRQLGVDE